MTHETKFTPILDKVFADLTDQANVTIDYYCYTSDSYDDGSTTSDVVILSVNGCETAARFEERITRICSALLVNLAEAQIPFRPKEKSRFLKLAREMFEQFLQTINFKPDDFELSEEMWHEHHNNYLFTVATFNGNLDTGYHLDLEDLILERVRDFSDIWQNTITKTKNMLIKKSNHTLLGSAS